MSATLSEVDLYWLMAQPGEPEPPSVGALRALLEDRPAWMAGAACAGSGVNLFPERGVSKGPALALCASCPVSAQCRDFAPGAITGCWAEPRGGAAGACAQAPPVATLANRARE